jgi:hypothetical protein
MGEMGKPGIVIHMNMGEDNLPDIPRPNAERSKLRANFLLGFDLELHGEPKIGMPGGQ